MQASWCSLMRKWILVLPLLLMGAALAQEKFRVDVKLVNVAFSVRDSSGRLLDNLTKDDLEVIEDAIPQKIAFFARSVDVPLTLGIVVDVSGSQDHFSKEHERDLKVFLKEVLGPKDRAFLIGFGNHIRLVSDFTQSSDDLIERWKDYQHHADRFSEMGPPELRTGGTAFYDSIYYAVTDKLAKEPGRKALLVFSDGEDNSSAYDMMSTIEAAQDANVLVYSIRYTDVQHGRMSARNKYGIRVMGRFAQETGGAHIDAKATDPHTYFRQIADELRSSYELGYYSTNATRDNTFRKIVIRPKSASLNVRSKTGYFAR